MFKIFLYVAILGCLKSLASCQVQDKVKFNLYTRDNPTEYNVIAPQGDIGNYSALRDTKILTHGWRDDGFTGWLMKAKDNYLKLEDVNVIIIDWGALAKDIFYINSAEHTAEVGEYTAELVNYLIDDYYVRPDQIHAIGHSLGAHVVGFLGKNVQQDKIARITGLDPAFPYFDEQPPSNRLNKTDAYFVDIIHTNGGTMSEGALAFYEPLGDVDFYVNGGKLQPGCSKYFGEHARRTRRQLTTQDMIAYLHRLGSSSCSHSRSWGYFLESMTTNADLFNAYPCLNDTLFEDGKCFDCGTTGCNNLGYNVNKQLTGNFFLSTRAVSPYNARPIQAHFQISSNQLTTTADLSVLFVTNDTGATEGSRIIEMQDLSEGDEISKVMGVEPDFGQVAQVSLNYTRRKEGCEPFLVLSSVQIYDPLMANRRAHNEEVLLPTGKWSDIIF